jgi:general secretion pathway protein H
MPTSIRNELPAKQAGFTLVELMVVLFLIGLAATAVVLTVGSARRGAGSQAEQFAARVAALRDRAVIESRPFAFWVRPSGYGFETRDGRQWRPLDKKPFATTDWRAPLTANVQGRRVVRVSFDANGLPSAPMDVTLSGGTAPLRVKLDAAGNVDVSR